MGVPTSGEGIHLRLQVRVTRGQHRGETRGFFLPPALLAGLFKVPMAAHRFQGPFAVDSFLQTPQCLVDGFAFLQFNFGQNTLTSSPETFGFVRPKPAGAPL